MTFERGIHQDTNIPLKRCKPYLPYMLAATGLLAPPGPLAAHQVEENRSGDHIMQRRSGCLQGLGRSVKSKCICQGGGQEPAALLRKCISKSRFHSSANATAEVVNNDVSARRLGCCQNDKMIHGQD